jgi:hypothetical protein
VLGLCPIAWDLMGQPKLSPAATVLPLGAVRVAKREAGNRVEAKTNGQRPGVMQPPLPPAPDGIDLINAKPKSDLRRPSVPSTPQIAQRFAPRVQAAPPPADPRVAGQAPLAAPLLALSSGVRTLAAVLILVAVLPNVILGALLWFRPAEPPSYVTALPPKDNQGPAVQLDIAFPVLSAPAMVEAADGETVAFPLTLDGTDGVPAGSAIVILGLPEGSALSNGRRLGATGWSLRPGEIGDLQLALPKGAGGDYQLVSQLVAPELRFITDAATRLRIAPGPAIAALATEDVAEPDPTETASVEQARADPDAATAMPEAMPLPTRRPDPRAGDDGRAGWVKPSAYVNLRKSPSSSAPVAGVVAKGAKLRVMARKRGWVQVANPATSQNGWIYSGYVETVP